MEMSTLLNQGVKFTVAGVEYNVRRLNVMDVFSVASLFGKIGIDLADIFTEEVDGEVVTKEIEGKQLVFKLIGVLPKCKEEVVTILSELVNVSVEDFKKLPPTVLIKIVLGLKDSEDLRAFFAEVRTVLVEMTPSK